MGYEIQRVCVVRPAVTYSRLRGSICSISGIWGNSVSVETIGSPRTAALPRCTPSNTFSASYCARRSAATSSASPISGTSSIFLLAISWCAQTTRARSHPSSITYRSSIPVVTDVFGSAIDSISTPLANQSSAFSSARMTSRSRYTFSIQALFDVVPRFAVRLFV